MTQAKNTKKHADFQDRYRRSSNFRSIVKNERFSISGDGIVEIKTELPTKE